MSYRLIRSAEDDIDRIVLAGAAEWGLATAARCNRLTLATFAALGAVPDLRGSRAVPGVAGVRAYHLRPGLKRVEQGGRVGQPRHLVAYRVARDGVVEIIGLAHDRMLLPEAAQRMQAGSGPASAG